jgi:hypothetical protein
MAANTIEFSIHTKNGTTAERLPVTQLVIAGWTGRDPVARDRHIAELEALGIARPASTPIYYPLAASRLTTAGVLEASGGDSSGEVEFVLLRAGSRLLVGVGSDHTDRKAETYSVTLSKQMCDHPIAPELWVFDDVAGHWDAIILRIRDDRRRARALPGRDAVRHAAAGRSDRSRLRPGTSGRHGHVWRHLRRHGRHPPGRAVRFRDCGSGVGPRHPARLLYRDAPDPRVGPHIPANVSRP